MTNTIPREQLKRLILEVIIREGTMGMSRRDLEKLDKIKKSSTNNKDFFRKASKIGLGIAAAAMIYGMGRHSASKSSAQPQKQQITQPAQVPQQQVQQPDKDDFDAFNAGARAGSLSRQRGDSKPSQNKLNDLSYGIGPGAEQRTLWQQGFKQEFEK